MSAAPTPGTWEARASATTSDFGIIAADPSLPGGFACVGECFSEIRVQGEAALEEAAANARLMAAAKDMLEALEMAVDQMRASARDQARRMGTEYVEERHDPIVVAVAAIAKATHP